MVPILIIVAVLLIAFYFAYAGLIRKRNGVQESFAGIDVQLTKRHDLIPNVIAVAEKFMDHEKNLLKEIVDLRTAAVGQGHAKGPKEIANSLKAENQLSNKLGALMVNVENYPTLKSDTSMKAVQDALSDVEENLAAARRFYNSSVRVLNDSIMVWPWSSLAAAIQVEAYPYFEATKDSKEVPDVAKMMA